MAREIQIEIVKPVLNSELWIQKPNGIGTIDFRYRLNFDFGMLANPCAERIDITVSTSLIIKSDEDGVPDTKPILLTKYLDFVTL